MVYMLKSTYDKLFEQDKEPKEGELKMTTNGEVDYLKYQCSLRTEGCKNNYSQCSCL